MSGMLATLSGAASVASALETLAFGAAGPVVLGGFAFQDFEVPATITLPVKQAVAVHKLIGGERVLDAMGPDYGDIAWAGVMLGAFAEARAQALKAVADAGQAAALTWGTWAFTVLPYQLTLKEGFQQVAYAIKCSVIRDDSAAPAGGATDLTTSVTQDMAAALMQGGAALSATLGGAQSAIQGLAPILPGSAGVASALASVAGAQGLVGAIAGTSATVLAGAGARAATAGTPVASISDLDAVTTAAGTLAQAVSAGGYLGRMAANLGANL